MIPAGGFRDYATGGPELGVMRWLVARDKDAEARARPSGSVAPARNCFLGAQKYSLCGCTTRGVDIRISRTRAPWIACSGFAEWTARAQACAEKAEAVALFDQMRDDARPSRGPCHRPHSRLLARYGESLMICTGGASK